MRTCVFAVCTLLAGPGGCGKKKEAPSVAPVNKPLGAPPEDMPEDEWKQWEKGIAERERERANRPPSEVQIQWPAAIDADLAEFNGWWITLKSRVGFSADHKQLTPETMDLLDDVVFVLAETPRIKRVEVQAHQHSRMETNGENITELRANTVKMYLVEQGIEEARIEAKGYGDTMPIESNTSEFGRRANTRVEIIVRQVDDHLINQDQ